MNSGINNFLIRISGWSSQTLALYAAVVTGAYALIFGVGADDVDARIATTASQLATEQGLSKESDRALGELDAIRAEMGNLNERFKVAAHKLPSEIPTSEVLKSIDTLATSAGVKIKSTDPRPNIKQDIVEMMPIHVTGQGSYSEITMFFYYMSSMERIAKVRDFVIEPPDPQTSGRVRTGTLRFSGDVVSYRYAGEDKPTDGKK